jgi:hypothetical protein
MERYSRKWRASRPSATALAVHDSRNATTGGRGETAGKVSTKQHSCRLPHFSHYLTYMERDVKPRRADDATRIALVALSWLIDWRGLLTVVTPKTFNRWHRKGFRLFWRWEVEATWTAPCTDRAPAAYRGDGDRESHVGRGTDCFGTLVEARYSRVASHGQALHARRRFTQEGCAVVDVEHLRAQSRQRGAGV